MALILILTSSNLVQSASAQAYTFTTLAGYPSQGSADGAGNIAQFNSPDGVAVDHAGNVYVADARNSTIRMVTPAGIVSTVAGYPGSFGTNDGLGQNARFGNIEDIFGPGSIAVGNVTNLYVAEAFNETIRMLTPVGANWRVSTIAGGPLGLTNIIDGLGSTATFRFPDGVAVDMQGNLYVVDATSDTIRMLSPVGTNWLVSTIAGSDLVQGHKDGMGSSARFAFSISILSANDNGIATDQAGNIYVVDGDTIRMLRPIGTNWLVTTIAGSYLQAGDVDGMGTNALFSYPRGIAVDSAGNLYVADQNNGTIRKLALVGTNWVVSTIAGSPVSLGNNDGTGTNALFNEPSGVGVDGAGNLYVGDTGNNTIREISSAGVVGTLAGGMDGKGSANGTGNSAQFNNPEGVAVDKTGNLYIVDAGNNTIRTITPAGVVNTLAGKAGNVGTNDGVGDNARFAFSLNINPSMEFFYGTAVDNSGNVYVADSYENTIREITSAGSVSTIAGSAGHSGTNDGDGDSARFWMPEGVTVDINNNVYVADYWNNTIRELVFNGTNWEVSTIAGLATKSGTNDGVGSNARFCGPSGVAVDTADNLYVLDSENARIRKITPMGTNWIVSTIEGNFYFSGPSGITVDNAGNLYVTDSFYFDFAIGSAIWKLTAVGTNWLGSIIGGAPLLTGSTDGTGASALFNNPHGIAVDNLGNLYVADSGNNTIRMGVFTAYGAANSARNTPSPLTGQITVTLLPSEAGGQWPGAQWRFPWEFGWHDSGETVSNLAVPGSYSIQFNSLPGWLAIPLSEPVILDGSNGVLAEVTNTYYPTISADDTISAAGSLSVYLGPVPPTGAGWFFLGQTNVIFPSNFGTNLLSGTYLIGFAPVSGRVTPPNYAVSVGVGQPVSVTVNYGLPTTPPSGMEMPFPVPTNLVSDENTNPFGFNGQLQSDVGYGSGVAVTNNVVLTAAHLVFNDQTLSYANEVYWFNQEEAGLYNPCPQQARGWYVLSGYAEQRTNDLESGDAPEQSTAASRDLDVAALYFVSPVANGGYGGYLPSDVAPNTWLSSTALKFLVGYPVDGSQFGVSVVPGQMCQTQPQPYPLSEATDPVLGQQQVYEANWFLGYTGESGGPVYVQMNGYYYPAGVYLGTLFDGSTPYASAVRAIDSAVVNLITNAAVLGDDGTNNTGGGPIKWVRAETNALSAPELQVLLGPTAAIQAGGGWRFQGQGNYLNAANGIIQATSLDVTVEFQKIDGWQEPTSVSANLQFDAVYQLVTNYMILPSAADVGAELSGPTTVAANGYCTYALFVTNKGPAPATNVTVTDTLPRNAGFVSASGGGVAKSNLVAWPEVAMLGNGGVMNYALTVTAPALALGKMTNRISLNTITADWNPGNNNASLVTLVLMPPVLVVNPTNSLSLAGTAGTTYRLEYSTNLATGQWLALRTNTIGKGGVTNVLSLPPTNGSACFYRAVWLP